MSSFLCPCTKNDTPASSLVKLLSVTQTATLSYLKDEYFVWEAVCVSGLSSLRQSGSSALECAHLHVKPHHVCGYILVDGAVYVPILSGGLGHGRLAGSGVDDRRLNSGSFG